MAAAAGALVLHVWLAWALNELLVGGQRPAPTVAVESVLQVVWLAPSAVTPIAKPLASIARRRLEVIVVARPRPSSEAVPAAPMPIPSPPETPLAGPLLGQARDWVQQQAPLEFGGANPLASRATSLPGQPAGMFRMRERMSPARIVGAIGQAFGNGEDPCVRNRANLAAYATGRDAKAMQLAVDLDRRHCRP